MKIQGYLFIVTGGASGLGEHVVRSIVEQGGFVSILDINMDRGKTIATELGSQKCFFPGMTDVTNEAHVDRALADTLQHFNQVVLAGAILCSGVVYPPKSIEGYGPDHALTSYSQFEHIIKINLLGTYCVAQKVANILLNNTPMNQDGERGMIITVSSILGLDGTTVGYGTSKAGVAGLTLPMARELSKFGIRVMSIAPGPFDTPILGRSSVHDVVAPFSLFPHRYGVPQEFTDLVMQIIHNPMLNGTVIRLDGALRS